MIEKLAKETEAGQVMRRNVDTEIKLMLLGSDNANVAPLVEFFSDKNFFYLAMPLYSKGDLQQFLQKRKFKPLLEPQTARII